MALTVARLRRAAVAHTLFAPVPLGDAVARLGFVQMDPLRAPARAQDLILRHRVPDAHVGDLDRAYAVLGLEEDLLYAYGVVSPTTWALLHPRFDAHGGPHEPDGLAAEVLAFVRERHQGGDGPTHPRTVAATFGTHRERNAWGRQSRATTRALEGLHYWGLLRVAARAGGVRLYAPARPRPEQPLAPEERRRRLAVVVATLMAPLPEVSLRDVLSLLFRYGAPNLGPRDLGGRRAVVDALLGAGDFVAGSVDGVRYVWPAAGAHGSAEAAARPAARLLAPFDPLVWDRRRFEHLWGWPYRFEAYTPAARRQRGHYALPLLWRDQMVGWATVTVRGLELDVATGFVNGRPRGRPFTEALDAEIARLRAFLSMGAES